ncbi:MAG: hypothetical protein A2W11_05430 [Ignavibacteria bacterium RBG_16_35_7]|nr:MAG: hypothetical protein A2W11_05430 [Ignavibacteria bacterium RBG_16_35_7]
MKAISISIITVFLITLLGCAPKKSTPLVGAWQVVSWERIAGDTLAWKFPGKDTGSDIIIWSEKYVLSVGRFKHDTTYINNSVGGSYTLEGTRYEETLIYFPDSTQIGKKVVILTEFKNDTLIRTYPVKENGQIDKSNYLKEKLVRLD